MSKAHVNDHKGARASTREQDLIREAVAHLQELEHEPGQLGTAYLLGKHWTVAWVPVGDERRALDALDATHLLDQAVSCAPGSNPIVIKLGRVTTLVQVRPSRS